MFADPATGDIPSVGRRAGRRFTAILVPFAALFLAGSSAALAQTAEIRSQMNERLFPVPLSADFDYGFQCSTAPFGSDTMDWKTWEGVTAPDALPEEIIRRAEAFMEGDAGQVFDYELARRMLDYVYREVPRSRAKAAYVLGVLGFDEHAQKVNAAKAIGYLEEAHDLGFSNASVYLGRIYFAGKHVPRDIGRAQDYFEQAIEQDDPSGKIGLARLLVEFPEQARDGKSPLYWINSAQDDLVQALIYRNSCGGLRDFGGIFNDTLLPSYDEEKARAWLEASALTGNSEAIVDLAKLYEKKESELDLAKARFWYEKADQSGDATGRVWFARFLLEQAGGTGTSGRARALDLLEAEIGRGNIDAHQVLVDYASGKLGYPAQPDLEIAQLKQLLTYPSPAPGTYIRLAGLLTGNSPSTDALKEAVALLETGFRLGSPEAGVALYKMLAREEAFDLLEEDPVTLLHASAQRGNADAMALLHDIYLCGTGVPQNAQTALDWRFRAAALRHTASLKRLAEDARARNTEEGDRDFLRFIRNAAEAGDPEAELELASALRLGIGTQPDPQAAGKWQDAALEPGESQPPAQVYLAKKILEGHREGFALPAGIEPDAFALDLLQRAADAGFISAFFEIGMYYYDRRDGLPDAPSRAAKAFLKAVDENHATAMWRLAELNLPAETAGGLSPQEWRIRSAKAGSVVARIAAAEEIADPAEQAAAFRRLAQDNACDPKAASQVARAIVNSVPALRETALELAGGVIGKPVLDFKLLLNISEVMDATGVRQVAGTDQTKVLEDAAELGSADAMMNLGNGYYDGRFGEQDLKQAKHWFREALRHDKFDAAEPLMSIVGNEARDGRTPIGDLLKDPAFEAIEASANKGDRDATGFLFVLYREVAANDPRFAKASEAWTQKAAEIGIPEAMMHLFTAYANGRNGYSQSDEKSTFWLAKAAESNYPDAFQAYAISLQLGVGVDPDPEAAQYWLKRSLEAENVNP